MGSLATLTHPSSEIVRCSENVLHSGLPVPGWPLLRPVLFWWPWWRDGESALPSLAQQAGCWVGTEQQGQTAGRLAALTLCWQSRPWPVVCSPVLFLLRAGHGPQRCSALCYLEPSGPLAQPVSTLCHPMGLCLQAWPFVAWEACQSRGIQYP